MTDAEKLKLYRTALESLHRALRGMNVIIKQGGLFQVVDMLQHLEQRTGEILHDSE